MAKFDSVAHLSLKARATSNPNRILDLARAFLFVRGIYAYTLLNLYIYCIIYSIMNHKKAILLLVTVIVILLFAYFAITTYSTNKQNSLSNPQVITTVSPEVTTVQPSNTKQKSEVTLSFTLIPIVPMTIFSAYLETPSTTTPSKQIPLTKQNTGTYTGNLAVPSEWLNKAQTISFILFLNNVKTSQTIRFAVTDIPVTLPLDPGEAGKVTLAGIDSDSDGVRDDLQREIVFMYPENNLVRRILRAEMKVTQEVLLTDGDHDYYVALLKKEFALDNCYIYTQFGLRPFDGNAEFLHNLVKNTSERKRVYEEHNKIALPFASDVNFNSEACTQPLVQGQY